MKISIPCLGHDLQRATEIAAIAAADVRGSGDAKTCDKAATGAMRARLGKMLMRGTVLNTEGELDGCDRSSMLEMGEQIGLGWFDEFAGDDIAEVVIAADSLEGTELCAENEQGAICTAAIAGKGGILSAPENYMLKYAFGPDCRGKIDPEAPIEDILDQVADATNKGVDELVLKVLGRDRHIDLIRRIRMKGAEVGIIRHGDLTAGLLASIGGSGITGAVGIGGGPETFLVAAANLILGGEIYARFVSKEELEDPKDRHVIPDDMAGRLRDAGFINPGSFMTSSEMVPANDVVFALSAVTETELLRKVTKFEHGGRRVNSCLMIKNGDERIVRWSDTEETKNPNHVFRRN